MLLTIALCAKANLHFVRRVISKWTYRFFEAIMCKSIPIVEKQGVDHSMDGFNYFLQDERNTHCYCTKVCDDNYRLLVARHSLLESVLDISLEI